MNETPEVGEDGSITPIVASDQDFSEQLLVDYSAFLEPNAHEVGGAPEQLVQLVLDQLPSSNVSSDGDVLSFTERRLEKARGPRLWKVMALAASTVLVTGVGGFSLATLGEADAPSGSDMAAGATDEVVPGLRGNAGTEGIDGAQVGELVAGLLILDLPAASSDQTRDRVSRVWVPDTAPAAAGYSILFVPETPSGTAESQARTFCSTTGNCVVATIPEGSEIDEAALTSVNASIATITNALKEFDTIKADSRRYWLVDGIAVNVAEMQKDLSGIQVVTSLGGM
jgi:hypothetical protein